jgi:heat shock protein HslJ
MKRFIVLLGLIAVSCGGDATGPTPPSGIQSTNWRLQTLQHAGAALVTVPTPDQYTLMLDTSGQAGVRADCNSCGGRYTLDGSTLTLTPLACTLIACPPGSLDSDYLALLAGETQTSMDGAQLVLSSSRGTLRFSR